LFSFERIQEEERRRFVRGEIETAKKKRRAMEKSRELSFVLGDSFAVC
jgi:hypothetical protein